MKTNKQTIFKKALPILILLTLVSFAYAQEAYLDKSLIQPKYYKVAGTVSKKELRTVALTAQRYAQFWHTGSETYLREALSPSFIDLNLPEGRPQGIEGPKIASETFRKAVPNLSVMIEQMFIIDKQVIMQYEFKGNFTGVFKGQQGSGEEIKFKAVDIYTVQDGKITHNWHLEDNLTLLLQMKTLRFNP